MRHLWAIREKGIVVWEHVITLLFSRLPLFAVWILIDILRTDSIVKVSADRCQKEYQRHACRTMDGVVSCIHTEGSIDCEPLNKDKILRTLAGFIVHPNVGAAIVVFNAEYCWT